jgi:lactate permease
LLGAIASKAHWAAILGLAGAFALFASEMPAPMAGTAAACGSAFGLLPIGWLILNVMLLYQLPRPCLKRLPRPDALHRSRRFECQP